MAARSVCRSDRDPEVNEKAEMTIARDLLQRHIQALIEDHAQWQTLIADDLVWKFPYVPAIRQPEDKRRQPGLRPAARESPLS